jgi:hypothetical protein
MIRRAFWLGVGAAGGIMGYRRAVALGRRLTGQASGKAPGREVAGWKAAGEGAALRGESARSLTRDLVRATREVRGFSRDVREGMELYSARRPRGIGPTLPASNDNDVTVKDDR